MGISPLYSPILEKPLEVEDNPGYEKTIGIWDGKLYVFEEERIRLFAELSNF
ncbi:MAG: hypothetical protein QXU31_01665 [Archaeoglobaceae archaeon]